jgi:Putative metallopeptidase
MIRSPVHEEDCVRAGYRGGHRIVMIALWPTGHGLFAAAAKRLGLSALLLVLLLKPAPLHAQDAPSPAKLFQARLEAVVHALANEPRLKLIRPENRQALIEFILGNMLFVVVHEIGHAVIGEMEMPVLGREEDAADAFAIYAALWFGDDFSHRILVEATQGWFLSDRRDRKEGEKLAFYGAHGIDVQRAYQIVCFMVGSDPVKFKDLADKTKLPEDRRATCQRDYRNTAWSWEMMLKPHFRASDAPKQKIEIIYGEGKGKLDIYARSFRAIQFLETVAEDLADRFAWPRSFVVEMRSCDNANAHWSGKDRKLLICYELAEEFAELYAVYGQTKTAPKSKRQR